ncbi:MAG: SPOR domain-containing protein [Acidobacteriaceae bacterium]|nr:SPOR domain-containing protein [Acidobacteriaceae bacterium]
MLRTSENETEILLGNKQLLGIFFAVALLLGLAFYGGYAVGKGVTAKKASATATSAPADESSAAPPQAAATGGETHSVPADAGVSAAPPPDAASAPALSDTSPQSSEPPLGSPKRKNVETQAANPAADSFAPRTGQTFLQVTAVGRDEAFAIADVLQKKGFHAHAAPKPGGGKLYRVLVGPVRDAADLSSTRDSLRKTGFREVIVQRY